MKYVNRLGWFIFLALFCLQLAVAGNEKNRPEIELNQDVLDEQGYNFDNVRLKLTGSLQLLYPLVLENVELHGQFSIDTQGDFFSSVTGLYKKLVDQVYHFSYGQQQRAAMKLVSSQEDLPDGLPIIQAGRDFVGDGLIVVAGKVTIATVVLQGRYELSERPVIAFNPAQNVDNQLHTEKLFYSLGCIQEPMIPVKLATTYIAPVTDNLQQTLLAALGGVADPSDMRDTIKQLTDFELVDASGTTTQEPKRHPLDSMLASLTKQAIQMKQTAEQVATESDNNVAQSDSFNKLTAATSTLPKSAIPFAKHPDAEKLPDRKKWSKPAAIMPIHQESDTAIAELDHKVGLVTSGPNWQETKRDQALLKEEVFLKAVKNAKNFWEQRETASRIEVEAAKNPRASFLASKGQQPPPKKSIKAFLVSDNPNLSGQ